MDANEQETSSQCWLNIGPLSAALYNYSGTIIEATIIVLAWPNINTGYTNGLQTHRHIPSCEIQ